VARVKWLVLIALAGLAHADPVPSLDTGGVFGAAYHAPGDLVTRLGFRVTISAAWPDFRLGLATSLQGEHGPNSSSSSENIGAESLLRLDGDLWAHGLVEKDMHSARGFDGELGLRWTSGMGWGGLDAIARTPSCTGCDMHAAFGLDVSIGYHADGFYPFTVGVLLELLVAWAAYA
jgi:hypothetical protein